MQCDLLIKSGTIVDGTGRDRFEGDVAVRGGKIIGVFPAGASLRENFEAGSVLDAGGLTVCPGFIDMHSHSDLIMHLEEHPKLLTCLMEQGITTLVGGNCGFSLAPLAKGSKHLDLVLNGCEFISEGIPDIQWDSMASYLGTLERRGVALNLAMLAGHGTLRWSLWGTDYAYPGETEMAKMEGIVEESFKAGACGLSLGLGYEPGMFVDMRELEQLARCVKKHGRLLTVHLKALSRISPAYRMSLFPGEGHNLRALADVIKLSEKTGVKIQISHLMFVGTKTWPSCGLALDMIAQARSRGVDIAFDSFPYMYGNTTIYIAFPAWFLKNAEENFRRPLARGRLRLEWLLMSRLLGFTVGDILLMWGGHPEMDKYKGKSFSEIARDMNCSVFDAVIKVGRLSLGKACCLFPNYNSEETLRQILAHPLNTFETDAIITSKGLGNPSAFGACPGVIQKYHKELGILSLEEAVAKMTGNSARRLGIRDRGALEAGNWADITVFDYNEIRDNTTLSDTGARPSGIRHVFINGEEVVRNGAAVPGKKSGKVLRCC